MTLLVPYIVYGEVTYDGSAQSGVTVAVDAAETTTDENGKYQLNIQTVATDGQSVTVTATYSGDSAQDSFTLDVSDLFKELDLSITASIPPVSVSGFSIYGIKPLHVYGSKKMYINKV